MTLVEDLFTAPEVSDCTALFFVYLILFNVICLLNLIIKHSWFAYSL